MYASIYSSLESPWSTSYPSWFNFFDISYDSDVTSGNLSKLVFIEYGRSVWAQMSDGRGRRQIRMIAFWYYINISAVHCLVLWQSARVTDRRTDRRVDRGTALAISHPVAENHSSNCSSPRSLQLCCRNPKRQRVAEMCGFLMHTDNSGPDFYYSWARGELTV